MTQLESETVRPPHTPWDALIAAVLGAALLTAGWLDVRSYLSHRRDAPPPEFAFLQPTGSTQADANGHYRRADTVVWLDHIGGLEEGSHVRYRHALGPRGGLIIYTPNASPALLRFKLYNPLEGQDITVSCNGQVIEQFTRQPKGEILRRYPLTLRPGNNEVTFTFARYNHGGADLAPEDARPMAATFFAFDLTVD